MNNQHKTSWQGVSGWYKDLTKNKGHYFHEHVVVPGVLRLLNIQQDDNLLDLACGTGVLGRAVPKNISYVGIDIVKGLVEEAKRQDKSEHHKYLQGDVTQIFFGIREDKGITEQKKFSKVTCLLAIQNIENSGSVFTNVSRFIQPGGIFILVLNHPAFRIPRQTSWGIDEQSKLQYRRVNRYLSPIKIPISMHPGKGHNSPLTWSFHEPISFYVNSLSSAGFVITAMEEWASDKESEGRFGKMENRARAEIPLFLTIVATKK